jgi:predicted nucleic acid-binding protein
LSRIVLDASVALAWCFPDEASEYADAVLVALEGEEAVVPAIWAIEVANALLVGERRKRIRETDILRFSELLRGLAIREDSRPFADALNGILPLARAYDLSAYDAAYLDVSIRHGAPIATLDIALQKAANAKGIKHFQP